MRENPILRAKEKYFANIKINKIYPIRRHKICEYCGNKIRFKQMYECSLTKVYSEQKRYYYGCSQCFYSEDNFREFLEESKLLFTEEDWITDAGEFCYPIQKRVERILTDFTELRKRVDNLTQKIQ